MNGFRMARVAVVGLLGMGVRAYAGPADRVESVRVSHASGIAMDKRIDWDPETERVTNIVYRVNNSLIAAYAYQYPTNSSRISRMTRLDGSYWIYGYDAKDQLATAGVFTAEGVPVPGMQFVYEYDEIGNTVKAGSLGTNGQPRHTFQANDLNQHVERNWGTTAEVMGSALTSAVVTVNDVRAARQGEHFRVEVPVDNPAGSVDTQMTVRAVWFDGTNDLVAQGGGKLYVPKAEEAVEHRPSGAIKRDSRFFYSFNFRDQLTSVVSLNASANFKLKFDYYPCGQRARKIVCSADESVTNRVHQYYYDDWNLIAESQVSGSMSQVYSYTWGLDLEGQRTGRWGQDAGGIGGLLMIEKVSGGVTNVYFPVCDRNGIIGKVVDAATGAVVADYTYSPFGALIGVTGPATDVCPFRFQSKYYDRETELYYFGYRYYDPASTKWLSRDPKGLKGSINETCFCENDPVNYVDPRGLKAYGRDFVGPLDWMDWVEAGYTQDEVNRVYVSLATRDRHIFNPGLANTSADREVGRRLLERALGVPVAAAWNPTFCRLGRSVGALGAAIGRNGLNWNPIKQIGNVVGGVTEGVGFGLNWAGVAADVTVAGVEKVPLIRKAEPTYLHTKHLYDEAIAAVKEQRKSDVEAMVFGWMHSEGAIHGTTILDNLSDEDLEFVYARTFGAGGYRFRKKAMVDHHGNRSTQNRLFKRDFVPGGAGLDWVRNKDDIHWKDVDAGYIHGLETYIWAHLIEDDVDDPFDGIAKEYFRLNALMILGH